MESKESLECESRKSISFCALSLLESHFLTAGTAASFTLATRSCSTAAMTAPLAASLAPSTTTPLKVSLATLPPVDLFSMRSPLLTTERVIASMTMRTGMDAEIASSCVVLTQSSHGRGSSPGLTGFSEENLYPNDVSSPAWWRSSSTAPSATAFRAKFPMPSVRPSLQSEKSPTLNVTDAELRTFAGLARPTFTMR